MKVNIAALGAIVVVAAILLYAFMPYVLDPYLHEGKYVKFVATIDRGLLQSPTVTEVQAYEAQPFSIVSVTDSKVLITCGGRNFESTILTTGGEGGTGDVTTTTQFMPYGTYACTMRLYEKGGEICLPIIGCNWAEINGYSFDLEVYETGVRTA